MRQILLFLSAILLCCCSADNEVKAETPANTGNNSNTGKTLVVYYSYTGNSREIVNTLTSQIQADVLEIQPAEKGLKYEANNYALGTQLLEAIKANPNDLSSYPAIDPVATSLSGYQNIIVVTPLWWSQMAAIMQTYLFQSAAQMAGKHVAMIVSSHSSGISGVVSDARRLLPDVTWMGDALWINASNHSRRASLIEDWLKTLNFAEGQTTMDKMYITIGGQTQSVTLVDNAATRALLEKLRQATVTVTLKASDRTGKPASRVPEGRREQHQRNAVCGCPDRHKEHQRRGERSRRGESLLAERPKSEEPDERAVYPKR